MTPPLCACGCGKEARTPKGWAGRGCALRAIPREERSARSKAFAASKGKRYFQALAKKANRVRRYQVQWDDLLDAWLDDRVRPADALRMAYRRGYRNGFSAAQRGHRMAKEYAA